MNAFEFVSARTVEQARDLQAEKPGSVLKAGGIDLLDHLKERLVEPPRLVNLRGIAGLDRIERQPDGGLRIGALATLAEVAAHPGVQVGHAALAEACGEAASPQIRNVATIGGNVLQRPRCWYYRLESYHCLKKGGDTCFAVAGENRYHSIFGDGPCVALHPSNAAVPLVALDALFVLDGPKGRRQVPAAEFFRPPEVDPERENQLAPGEVLTEIRVPPARGASRFASIREKAAFDWPLAAVALVLRREGTGPVSEARVVLGAVAPVPRRALEAETALAGRPLTEGSAQAAADAATAGANPLSDNAYKLELVRALVRRTVLALA